MPVAKLNIVQVHVGTKDIQRQSIIGVIWGIGRIVFKFLFKQFGVTMFSSRFEQSSCLDSGSRIKFNRHRSVPAKVILTMKMSTIISTKIPRQEPY